MPATRAALGRRRGSPVLVAIIAVATATAAACGAGHNAGSPVSGAGPATTPPRPDASGPAPLGDCRSAGRGWTHLATSGQYQPSAARLGDGRLGIVFANDSVNDTCVWMPARALATRGYAVAVFETAGNYGYEAPQVREVAAALRRAGARRIALIGASVGARAVLQVAAQHPRGLAGVVALSAERKIIPAYPGDLLPIGRRVRVPVLSVGSRGDPLTAEGNDTRAWHRTIPRGRLLLLTRSDHGVELLAARHRRRVRGAIRAFLRSL